MISTYMYPQSSPFPPYLHTMPLRTGVIGALGTVAAGPMLSGGVGDIGLICFTGFPGRAASTIDIVNFFENTLSPLLGPFPGPRSIVILDNAPSHRERLTHQAQHRITVAVQRRGALLIWNPPNSPDLNPIEHIWAVTKALMMRRIIELAAGLHGPPRPFTMVDLQWCLQTARLSIAALNDIFTRAL